MTLLKFLCIYFCFLLSLPTFSDEIPIHYKLMNQDTFQKIVVGNTIVGTTRQSHSLYMLYFLSDGSCELWKQSQIYTGRWWIEKDSLGKDVVRAFWPEYNSSEPKSLFSPKNPRYGTATSLRYYFDLDTSSVFIANKMVKTSVILVPGRAFPQKI